jgi:hypothetical protein
MWDWFFPHSADPWVRVGSFVVVAILVAVAAGSLSVIVTTLIRGGELPRR